MCFASHKSIHACYSQFNTSWLQADAICRLCNATKDSGAEYRFNQETIENLSIQENHANFSVQFAAGIELALVRLILFHVQR